MWKLLLRTAISVGFIVFLFYMIREDIPEILHSLKTINIPLFLFCVLLFFSSFFVLGRRLELILSASEVPLKFSDCLNLTLVGMFFNNFLPSSVGGDLVKAMSIARLTRSKVKSAISVLMDRIFGLFTFVLIPAITYLFYLKQSQNSKVPIIIYSLLAISCVSFVMIFNRSWAKKVAFLEKLIHIKIMDTLKKVYNGLHNFKNHKWIMVQSLLLSVAGQTVNIFVCYLIALALGAKVSFFYFLVLIPVIHLMSMIPSLGGLGVREYAYMHFLQPIIGREIAVALGILWLFLLFLASFAGGIVYLFKANYHVHVRGEAVPRGVSL